MKTAIIVPYFGTLPGYFQLFLDSCKKNEGFDWLIFTDDKTEYTYPENVHRLSMTFGECKKLVQSRFDFEIALPAPQKLCDYKCAYGYIFSDYLADYDFWGHCDLDQIFGDLGAFVTSKRLESYDKIYSLGHLTLYRNTEDNNKTFMLPLDGKERYKEVFSTEKGCAFDEWIEGNVNQIYLTTDRPVLYENDGADINPYKTVFNVVTYNVKEGRYESDSIDNCIFEYNGGKVNMLYLSEGSLKKREYPYVHLQKRRMKDKRKNKSKDKYYIVPNSFVDGEADPVKLIKKARLLKIFNYQYFRVKSNSLKYRLKNKDWKFTSVFK